jgi:hypothetical protein
MLLGEPIKASTDLPKVLAAALAHGVAQVGRWRSLAGAGPQLAFSGCCMFMSSCK